MGIALAIRDESQTVVKLNRSVLPKHLEREQNLAMTRIINAFPEKPCPYPLSLAVGQYLDLVNVDGISPLDVAHDSNDDVITQHEVMREIPPCRLEKIILHRLIPGTKLAHHHIVIGGMVNAPSELEVTFAMSELVGNHELPPALKLSTITLARPTVPYGRKTLPF
jgi:hypothetical protein